MGLDWDTYFMEIAKLTSQRSSCIRRKVGCIIVKDNNIVSLGYNGTPSGFDNCNKGGCKRCNNPFINGAQNLHECLCIHAEENALLKTERYLLKGSTLYCSLSPCIGCLKKIIQVGIKRIVYIEEYSFSEEYMFLVEKSGLIVEKFL